MKNSSKISNEVKKLIFLVLFSVLIIPGLASADIVSDLQAQINQLLQQIMALQAQLAAQQTTTPTTPTSCPNLTYNLYLGLSDSQTGGQVSQLQRFLAQDSSIYPEGLITGYFGPATERAVQAWQAKNSIVSSGSPDTTGYGVVGSKTRAAINKSCQTTTPSITVLSPNGGESWEVGKTYNISWSLNNLSQPNCAIDLYSSGASNPVMTIVANYPKNSYPWQIPSTLSTTPYTNQYKILVRCAEIGGATTYYDQSNNYFSIIATSTTANQPPVIDSVSGPSTLSVGQVGTWIIKAHDPENKQMIYSVNWGDEAVGMGAPAMIAATPFTQTVSLAHSYSSAGIYSPTFTISDGSLSAKTSISVNVGAVPTPVSALKVEGGIQPYATLFPLRAARVPFTVIKFTAPADQDIKVNSLTVERTGLSSDALFSGVVLLDENGIQIGAERILNSSHRAVLSEPFTVSRGGTKTLTIAGNRADTSAYAGQIAYLSLVGVNAGSVPISGNLPMTGAGHTANESLSIGSMSVSRGATDPGMNQTKAVGTSGYTFSSVTATAGPIERARLMSIRWYQSGSMPQGYFANVKTYVDGVAYSTYVGNDGHYYTSIFDNGIVIEKGLSKEISLKADILDGVGQTADFDILNRADLYVKGEIYGYGIMPPNGTDTFGSDDGSFHQNTLPWYDAFQVSIGGTATPTPSITVLSPNGGDVWKIGETKRVSWNAANVNYVKIYIEDTSTDAVAGSGSTQLVYESTIPASTGYFDWTIQKNRLPGYTFTFPRTYKIRIDGGGITQLNAGYLDVRDWSDNSFTIQEVATITPTLSANAQKLDYNNDGKLDQADANFLNDVLLRKITCPTNKICDVNRSGVFTVADVVTLTNIILGTGSVPDYKTSLLEINSQKLDYNNDNVLDSKDSDFLTGVMLRKWTCPTAKTCDVNQDGNSATISDVTKLVNITLGTTPVPDFGLQSSNASLNQMAGVLEGMRGILEQLAGLLR